MNATNFSLFDRPVSVSYRLAVNGNCALGNECLQARAGNFSKRLSEKAIEAHAGIASADKRFVIFSVYGLIERHDRG